MGRMLLLIVGSLAVITVLTTFSKGSTTTARSAQLALSQGETLAAEAAQSGFDVAVQAVLADLDARPVASSVRLDAAGTYGDYSYRTASTPYGSVDVEARGAYAGQNWVIAGEVLELLSVGAPIVIHAEEAKVEVKGKGRIEGADHRASGAGSSLLAGPAGERPAIGFTTTDLLDTTTEEWKPGMLARLGGSSPSGLVQSTRDLSALSDAARSNPGTLTFSKFTLEDATLGSAQDPVVIVANEAVLKEGARGYGVLVVDGPVTMEKDAQWEGLIIVTVLPNDKVKFELKDDARILGGVAFLGTEFSTETGGTDGFPGGHMDLDIFEGSGAPLDRSYHKHEWDDKYDLTYVDFLTAPDLAPAFADFRAANMGKTMTVEFENAYNSAGTFEIASGAGATVGRTENGFSGAVHLRTLTSFRVAFDGLCSLRGTSPGNVKSDGVSRDRAFTARFYDAGTLVFAVSAYEHAKNGPRDGDPSCGAGTGAGDGTIDLGASELYGNVEIKIEGKARVLYSEEAAGSAGRALGAARGMTRGFPVVSHSVPVSR